MAGVMRLWACVSMVFVCLLVQNAGGANLEGNWLGTIQSGPVSLRLVFHLSRGGNGTFTGTCDSPDQGALGLPLGAVTLNGNSVEIELKTPPASYSGTLNSDGTEMTGTWKQGGGSVPLTFRRVASVPALERPQEPKGPFPYRAEDVVFPSKAAGVQLAGTLTLPESGGPCPAVLLITGSGAQDRDEAIFGHRPFLVIADYLTRHGIAVLRVDDRGTAKSTGVFKTATTADFVEDAAGSLAYLKSRKEVDARRLGLIGHSEGADIAPMLATQDKDVAFIVLLAGTGVNGREVLEAQAAAMARAAGASPSAIQENLELQERLFAAVDQPGDPAQVEARVRAVVKEALEKLPEQQRAAVAPGLEQQVTMVTSPWFRYFLTLDPASALRQVKIPVLALDGSLDLQVVASQNLPAIVKALEEGGNPDYEIVKFPNLNHLFQTAKTGLPGEYSNISETIAPSVLEVMTNWIRRHTGLGE